MGGIGANIRYEVRADAGDCFDDLVEVDARSGFQREAADVLLDQGKAVVAESETERFVDADV